MAATLAAPVCRPAGAVLLSAKSTHQRARVQARCTVETSSAQGRRELLCATASVLALSALQPALALEEGASPGSRVYLDVTFEGQAQGRITIELNDNETIGCRRFFDLAVGIEGVDYRRSKFDALYPGGFIRNAGVAALSYGDGEPKLAGGESTAELEREMDSSTLRHDGRGIISLVVKPSQDLVESTKLVAQQGKLVNVTERAGVIPNGTGFAITFGPAPQLDSTNLVVGRVVDGFEVLTRMEAIQVVKDNSSSPWLAAGKAIGDKRATVAELGFNRPFGKTVVSKSGRA